MLRPFLISLIFVQTIVIAALALDTPPQHEYPPWEYHSAQTSEYQNPTRPRIQSSILSIECDPNCRKAENQDRRYNNWMQRIIQQCIDDPIALFTGLLVVVTGLLVYITGRNIVHLRRTERAYISGGGPAEITAAAAPITFRRGNVIVHYTLSVVGGDFIFQINNHGKTPGNLYEIGIGFCDAAIPIPEIPVYRFEHFFDWIGPGTQSRTIMRIPIPAGFVSPAVYGRLRYKDIFNKERSSGFILEISHIGTIPIPAPQEYTKSN
jgi:hypothetical protein